jgi:DNA-binding winged helix-turn-helix (wHTH) protein/tetratricopeptide (TPR) repeat protein
VLASRSGVEHDGIFATGRKLPLTGIEPFSNHLHRSEMSRNIEGLEQSRRGSPGGGADGTGHAMRFRFGLFELDEQARELRRAGQPVRIQPKPFELLRLLLRERDRVVPFDELMARLWPGEIVSPASLNRAVSHARRALDDLGRGALVRSVPRQGYRFMGPVAEIAAGDELESPPVPSSSATPSSAPGVSAASERGVRAPGDRLPARSLASGASGAAGPSCELVGRREPLARLEALCDAVVEGATRIALVRGRAGIGKTRLVEELGRRAEARGLRMLVGRARDGEGFPAFWLWIQILRSLVGDREHRAEVLARIGSGELPLLAAVLRTFTPELAPQLESELAPERASATGRVPEPTPDLSDGQQRFRFFDASQRVLAACAHRRPILLVLEDLQWADSGSLRLLEHIALELRSAPLLLVMTLREEPRERGHRVDRTIGLLEQQAECEPVRLGSLSRGDVAQLLAHAAGRPVPVDLVSELYARTEGVPLFVGEAIRLLRERGDLERPDRIPRDGATLPARSVGLIRRTIEGLSAPCAELMQAAATWGREFSLPAAAAVAGCTHEQALDLLDEAIRAGIVEPSADETTAYRFAHALFREAIYDEMALGTRARLHRAAADRLEQQHGGVLEPIVSELAYHHHRALAVGDPERAFAVAIQAAQQARTLFAWEQTAIHLEQAVAALEHLPVVEPRLRVETLLSLGEAQRLSGHRDRREAAFEAALEIAKGLGDASSQARAAIGLCDVSEWSAQAHPRAEALLREALERVGPEDPVTRARLTARLAYLAVRDRAQAEPLGRAAAARARESGDPDALQESLYVLHYLLAGPDDLAERERLVAELSGAAKSCRDREAGVIALLDIACDGIMQGDLERSRRHRAMASELAGDHPSPTMVWHLRVWDTGKALLEGRFREAEQAASDALLFGRRLGHPYARACFSGQICLLDREIGRDGAIVERLAGRTRTPVGASTWSEAVLGRALRAMGDEAGAREIFEGIASQVRDPKAFVRNIRWNGTLVELSMLAVELGATEQARPLLELLSTAREQHGVLPIPIAYGGPFSRCMAGLSALLGLADDAIGLYEEALASAEALGARPTVAGIGLDLAPLVARAGDVVRAGTLARESLALAEELGMVRVAERGRAVAGRLR